MKKTMDYSALCKRDNYSEELEYQINKWNIEFDILEDRIRRAGADPKVDYDEVITALRQHKHKTKD